MIRACREPGCPLPVDSNQLCTGHRTQQRRGKTLHPVRIHRPDHCHVRGCQQPADPRIPGWCTTHLDQADPRLWDRLTPPARPRAPRHHMPCTDIDHFTEQPIDTQTYTCTNCADTDRCLTLGLLEAARHPWITWTYGGLTPDDLYALLAAKAAAA